MRDKILKPMSLPAQKTEELRKWVVFDTHPIQYRAPIFRELHRRGSPLQVYFFDDVFDGDKWWFHEVGTARSQAFNVPLLEGYPCKVLALGKSSLPQKWIQLRSILKNENPEAVVIYGYYLPEHWILRLLCQQLEIPLIFIGETFQRSGSLFRRAIKVPLQNLFFSGVSQYISIGEKTRLFYEQKIGASPRNITHAKYCTDVQFFMLSEEDSAQIRKNWRDSHGISQEAFVISFVGRLFERKRPFDVVELQKILEKISPDFHTVMAGNGPMEGELKIAARDVEQLHLLSFQNQQQLREMYHGADVLFVPSEYETWGLVINEAFAASTPAVVTQTCGAANDLVTEGETGFVFPVGDLKLAARRMIDLHQNSTQLRAMGEKARTKVQKHYSIEQFADAFEESLSRIRQMNR